MHGRQIIVDTETTGLDPNKDSIVELACIELKEGNITQKIFHIYCRADSEISPSALKIHGLTADFLQDKPTFCDQAADFVRFIRHAELIFFNSSFHVKFIDAELKKAGMSALKEYSQSITNVTTLARKVLPDLHDYSLANLTHYFSLQTRSYTDQRALRDCILIGKLNANLHYIEFANKNKPLVQKAGLAVRCLTENKFLTADSITKPLKTAILVDEEILPLKRTKRLNVGLQVITSHRPIKAITRRNEAGSPIEVSTPKDTLLSRAVSLGAFSIYSNHPSVKPIKSKPIVQTLTADDSFFNSEQYRQIRKIKQSFKDQIILVTPDQLKKSQAERFLDIEQKFKKPLPARGLFMLENAQKKPASAGNYAQATQLFSGEMRWEWLPLISFMIMGNEALTAENIVAGTASAATTLMLNNSAELIAKTYPRGFLLIVKANLISDTHIATSLNYFIKTKDFSLPLTFDTQTTNRPHICYKDYIEILVKELIDLTQKIKTDNDELPKHDKSLLFFDRPRTQSEASAPVENLKQANVRKIAEIQPEENTYIRHLRSYKR